jgi:P27 family predicted phage terminase small subunit
MPRKSAASLSVITHDRPIQLRPPSSLSDAERTVFIDLVASVDARHFRQSDLPLLARYCEAVVLAEEAARQMRKNGAVIDGKTSPWLTVQEKAVRALTALSMRLRLSPQARLNPKTASRPEQRMSVYDEMRLEDDRDNGG